MQSQSARQERWGARGLTANLGFNSQSWGFIFEKRFPKATAPGETRRGAAEQQRIPGTFTPKNANSAKPWLSSGGADPGGVLVRPRRRERGTGERVRCCSAPAESRKGGEGICVLQRRHNLFVQQIPRRGRWRGLAAPLHQILLGLRRRRH